MIYQNGKPVDLSVTPTPGVCFSPEYKQASAVWNWLPKHRRDLLLDKAFEAVKRANMPPPGVPFIDDKGVPYSDVGQFVEELVLEFQERLFQLAGLRSEEDGSPGKYFLLGGMGVSNPMVTNEQLRCALRRGCNGHDLALLASRLD